MSAPFDIYDALGPTRPSVDTPYDEMFGAKGMRPEYRPLGDKVRQIGTEELLARAESLSSSYLAQGVTFDFGGVEPP